MAETTKPLVLLGAAALAGIGLAVVGWSLAGAARAPANDAESPASGPPSTLASHAPRPERAETRAACDQGEALLEDSWGASYTIGDPVVRQAHDAFSRAASVDPGSPCAIAGLAAAEALAPSPVETHGDINDPVLASRGRQMLARARALDSQSMLVARADAFLKSQAGDDVRAAQVMEAAVAIDGSRPGPWRDLGRYDARQFRVNRAKRAFERARALASSPVDQARLHLEKGEMDENLGLADAASAEYEAAARARPDHALAWSKLAGLHLRAQRCREAEAAASRALAIRRDASTEWMRDDALGCRGELERVQRTLGPHDFLRIGNAHRDHGRYADAEAAYARVTCCVPRTDLALARVDLALREGRPEQAWSALESIGAHDPQDVNVLVATARVQWARGQHQEGRSTAARALELELAPRVTAPLDAALGSDPDYRAMRERTSQRVEALFKYFEDRYDYQYLRRDYAATVWMLDQLGMKNKDRGSVRLLEDYLAHSAIDDVRARSADAIWIIGDRSSVPALLAALGDPSLKVKGFAASGLGDLGDRVAADPLLALFATLADNRDETKARIADALGKLGDRRAAEPIRASLDVIRDPAYVRWARPALDRLTR